MKIESLRKYRGRNLNGYFEDLPPDVRFRAHRWLAEMLERRSRLGKQTPQWTYAILIGQAKRLAQQSREERSAWGRAMLAKRGGYAVQERYRAEGRQPTAKATRVRLAKQAAKQRVAAQQNAATGSQRQPCQQAAPQQRPAGRQLEPTVFFSLPIGYF